jgi:hypothetical protein
MNVAGGPGIWRDTSSVRIRIYTTIILPLVLNRYEILSLTLRQEYRLGVFENRGLRRIFGFRVEII